jgi:DNA (cytosine-5)-methyltransferase 1
MPENSTISRSPRSLDFFCGIGGLTIGMERAGVETIGGIDNWEVAKRTFEHNLGLDCLLSDLRETTVEEIEEHFGIDKGDIDMIVGGPPCQGFSTVGKREMDDPRNQLWEHYRNLVNEIRPAYVVIENVEGMVVDNGGQVRDNVIKAFGEIGYRMRAQVLTSADYGVPQLRKRAIFLGWIEGLEPPTYPEKTHSQNGGNGLEPYVTVEEAIFDLPRLGAGEKKTDYVSEPSTDYQSARRNGAERLHNHEAANHTDKLIEIIKHVPDGGNRQAIPDELQPSSGFHNSYSRLASDKPAVAVTSNMRKPSSARCTHPIQHRGLTVREGLRLQTFDDDFVVLGSRTKQYKQVGNAVPPFLAQAVGEQVVEAFQANTELELRNARRGPVTPVEDPLDQKSLAFPD